MNEEMVRNERDVMTQEPLPAEPVAEETEVEKPIQPADVVTETPEAALWADQEPQTPVEPVYFIKPVRKKFSRIGWALSALLLSATAAQVLMVLIPRLLWGPDNWIDTTSWGMWISMLMPMYCVAMPLCILIMYGMPAERPQDAGLGGKNFFIFLTVFFFLSYSGNIIGTVLSGLLSGGTASNAVSDLAMDNNPLKILVMVILAPLLEELIFRKLLIDRTRRYGEKIAVFMSGLTFGLLHGNLFQFFYTFAGGLLLGYIYIRTGRLRYPVIIHGIMNFMGAVVAPLILASMDLELMASIDPSLPKEELLAIYQQILPGMLLYLGYLLVIGALFITGLVFFILKIKKLVWKPAQEQLPKGKCFKTVYLNVGMILFVLLCVASMVLSLFNGVNQQVFTKNDMQITLTSQFQEAKDDAYTVCYLSPDAAVFGNRETFANNPAIALYSETKYANTVIQSNGLQSKTKVKQIQGMTCFEFDNVYTEYDGLEQTVYEEYHYLAVVYKTSNSFWVFYFTTQKDVFEDYRQSILTWAESVTFQ